MHLSLSITTSSVIHRGYLQPRQNIVLSIRQLITLRCDSCSVSVGVGTPLIARLPATTLTQTYIHNTLYYTTLETTDDRNAPIRGLEPRSVICHVQRVTDLAKELHNNVVLIVVFIVVSVEGWKNTHRKIFIRLHISIWHSSSLMIQLNYSKC